MVDEVVAGEGVDELALAAPVRGGDGHELAVARASPRRPAARARSPSPSGANSAAATRISGSSLVRDASTIAAIAASSPTTSRRSRSGAWRAPSRAAADTRADTAVDSRGVRDLGARAGRGQARRRARRRCPAARRRSCSCASRSRPGRSCAPTGCSTTCGPATPTTPQHAAAKVARLRRALGDPALIDERRRRLPARGRARRGRRAASARRRDAAQRSTPATTRRRRAERGALARFRGEVLPAAGDWAAPHRTRLEEARATLSRPSSRRGCGSGDDVIGELEAAVAASPYQEGLWELLITALYRAGPPGRRARRLPARPRAARRRPRRSSPARG